MRKRVIALFAIALGACSTTPPGGTAARGKPEIVSRDGVIRVADGAFHCAGNGANPERFPKCQDGVPVMVLLKDDGSCLSLVPYYELVVHGEAARHTDIIWKLHGPAAYEFDSGNGIELLAKSGSLIPPETNYPEKLRVKPDEFRVRLKAGASPLTFQHQAQVKGPSGACTPIDPLISNK